MMDEELNKKLMSWISSKDTGLSSITLWSVMMNVENYSPNIPYDADDFGRCYRLLKLYENDLKYNVLREVARLYPIWGRYEQKWRKMTELYEDNNIEELNKILKEINHYV